MPYIYTIFCNAEDVFETGIIPIPQKNEAAFTKYKLRDLPYVVELGNGRTQDSNFKSTALIFPYALCFIQYRC